MAHTVQTGYPKYRFTARGIAFVLAALVAATLAVMTLIRLGSDVVETATAAVPAPVAEALADPIASPPTASDLTPGQIADAARLAGVAGAYATSLPIDRLSPAQRVETMRWTALAEFHAASIVGPDGLTDAQRAEAVRMTALAGWTAEVTIGADGLTFDQRVEAARWQALAEFYAG